MRPDFEGRHTAPPDDLKVCNHWPAWRDDGVGAGIEVGDDVTVAKLNVDDHPEIAARYGIQSIPTILIFKNGEVMDRIVGTVPKKILAQRLAMLMQLSW